MKTFLFSITFLLTVQYFAQQQSQIIFNEVPIHFNRNHDLYSYWEREERHVEVFEKGLNNNSLPIKQHHDLIHFIINGLKSGKLKAYKPDITENFSTPDEFFQTHLHSDSIVLKNFSPEIYNSKHDYISVLYDHFLVPRMDENGDYMYDEHNGDEIFDVAFVELFEQDFVSITFVEKWEFDTPNNKFSKKVLGFLCNTNRIDEETGDVLGIQPRFYIKMNSYKESDSNWKIANNYISTSSITGTNMDKKEHPKQHWWMENIESSKRYNLIQPLFSGNYNYIEASAPFTEPITDKNKALKRYEETQKYDEFGELMFDVHIDSSLYSSLDINLLGFVEDWYFDTVNYSFGKEVKGIMPYINNFDNDGLPISPSPLFLVNVNGNTVNQEVSNFDLSSHKMPLMLVNNKFDNTGKRWYGKPLKDNGFKIDSIDQLKMNSFFIELSKAGDFKPYSSLLGNTYKPSDNLQLLLNEEIIVPKIDPNTDDQVFDYVTDEMLFDTIYIPYVTEDIIGYQFLENWNYNISENKFDINITGIIPMLWYINPEAGDIEGVKELYMTKTNLNNQGEFTLIQSNHLITESLREYGIDEFWDYTENNEWLYPQEIKELIESLFEGIKSKKVQVYKPIDNEKIKLGNRASYVNGKTFTDIKAIQFEEDIYFNYTTGNFKKVVKSATLIIEDYNEHDELADYPWLKIVFND